MAAAKKPTAVVDVVEERAVAQRAAVDAQAEQRKEQHWWITFNKQGELDQQRMVDFHPNGVSYYIVKGERVAVPQSFINALHMSKRVGYDHGHPIDINGKKYLKKIEETEYSYQIHGPCSPEEAAEWRMGIKRAAAQNSDLQQINQLPEGDFVEVGVT